MPIFNDINLKEWQDSEILTDSLWVIPERDNTGKHSGFYHGNFIPQIPRQMLLRYTKKDEVVLDPFMGSGTTAYEAERLNRHFIGIDIQEELIDHVRGNLDSDNNFFELIVGNSVQAETFHAVKNILQSNEKESVDFAILHPPYFDIVKFSDLESDLSNSASLKVFLSNFQQALKNTINVLKNDRYLAIVIGDKYSRGTWIPLGFYCMYQAQQLNLTLKSVIVKNMEGNRAKQHKESIWRYRALSSDYYIFKHEYIFIFKK